MSAGRALGLVLLAVAVLGAYGSAATHGPALADEYIYLNSARHFSRTGSLDARYYDADAILSIGHPHQDVHIPGYVLALGATMGLVRGAYTTAVGLNVAAYLLSAWLVFSLSVLLGLHERAAWIAAALYLVFPAVLPYVYWALAEVLLGALFLGALVAGLRLGHRPAGAILTAVLFGLGVLVRESVLLGFPAVLATLYGRGRTRLFLGTVAVFMLVAYAPLSRHRAPGGANFWAPTSGRAFAFQAVQAARAGRWADAAEHATARARRNLRELAAASGAEQAVLASFAAIPIWALVGWRRRGKTERRVLLGLGVSWIAIVGLLFFVYVVAQWSGLRYLMFLVPPFLPWVAAGPGRGRVFPAAVAAAAIATNVATLRVFNAYKQSRQSRQEQLSDYIERYVDVRTLRRAVIPSGWLFGLEHYPVEVVSSLPSGGGGPLRRLERVIPFELLVLPEGSPLAPEIDGRRRYRRLNGESSAPPLFIYRRLK